MLTGRAVSGWPLGSPADESPLAFILGGRKNQIAKLDLTTARWEAAVAVGVLPQSPIDDQISKRHGHVL
jgi:hypothetical protein